MLISYTDVTTPFRCPTLFNYYVLSSPIWLLITVTHPLYPTTDHVVLSWSESTYVPVKWVFFVFPSAVPKSPRPPTYVVISSFPLLKINREKRIILSFIPLSLNSRSPQLSNPLRVAHTLPWDPRTMNFIPGDLSLSDKPHVLESQEGKSVSLLL